MGSEMCIRDRAGAGGGTGGESDTGGEAVIAGDAFEAVAGLGNGGLS